MNTRIETLFGTLNSRGIKYLLLTDFETELTSNDLDLFVPESARAAFEDTLQALGWYKRKEPSFHLNHHFYYSPASSVYLDVKFELTFANGSRECLAYNRTAEALADAVQNGRGVYRPFGIDAIILYAAHIGFKERGKLEPKHKQNLSGYLEKYAAETDAGALKTIVNIKNWLKIYFPHDLGKLQESIRPYFSSSTRRMVRSKRLLQYGFGVKVLFLGTDGSGKTTLIHEVQQKLNLKTKKLYLGMGESGWTSPVSKKLYHYSFGIDAIDKVYNALKQYVVLPVEFLFRIMPVKFKSKYSVVLIDRLPGSVFLENQTGKKSIYQAVLPKPDLVFFLHAAPEELVKRKPAEVTLERSKADIRKFRRVAEIVSGGRCIYLDTSRLSIGEARDLVIGEIYKHTKVYENLLRAEPRKTVEIHGGA